MRTKAIKSDKERLSDEYLDLKQLTLRVPLSKRQIENFIRKGVLLEGIHFSRPGGGKKRIFFWSAIEAWLRNEDQILKAHYARMEQARFPLS